ncbi:Putative heme iron utilization protein [Roseibacterium elongatum DSM 19469]|uniref:Putative heme iron utilization protein n=1 Tax=Roseicyclus elongatus DSM 19469 TaxID=1294273 RepID=W8RP69_9RHOB|nr:pyridoxamine 5'-phosphate oxidase family protein [Roseibacterium elongatum]AHM02919.1 Putative heme iron utilization protein [Roseibacterium elongatum DSM 19469]
MTERQTDPIRPTDDEARALARDLIATARHAALGVSAADTGAPMVTRIALVPGPDGVPLSLISTLSSHTGALQANPACSLLIGEPGPRGDPLTHPRLTLQARAEAADKSALKDHYLSLYPKARLYYDFSDFQLVRFTPDMALLNGGFGRAYRLSAADLAP